MDAGCKLTTISPWSTNNESDSLGRRNLANLISPSCVAQEDEKSIAAPVKTRQGLSYNASNKSLTLNLKGLTFREQQALNYSQGPIQAVTLEAAAEMFSYGEQFKSFYLVREPLTGKPEDNVFWSDKVRAMTFAGALMSLSTAKLDKNSTLQVDLTFPPDSNLEVIKKVIKDTLALRSTTEPALQKILANIKSAEIYISFEGQTTPKAVLHYERTRQGLQEKPLKDRQPDSMIANKGSIKLIEKLKALKPEEGKLR